MIRFEEAMPRHAKLIARNMRLTDVEELRAGWELEPEASILDALSYSYFARTLFFDLQPLAIFGLSALSIMPSRAQVWVFGTRAIDEHRITFAKASRAAVDLLFTQCGLMTNMIDLSDERALKWMRWLGGTLMPDHAFERNGKQFAQFIVDSARSRVCLQA